MFEVNNDFSEVMSLLPVLIPLILVQLGLMLAALIHACRAKSFKMGNKLIWILVILLVDIIGPVLYFAIGRGEPKEEEEED